MTHDVEAHCVTCTCGRRAPVQGSRHGPSWLNRCSFPAGTVAWAEHLEAWGRYASLGHGDQSAERVAERGGFDITEMVFLLGRLPLTWRPRGQQ